MPLENATLIHQLDPGNPAPTDDTGQGDDHLRMIKRALVNTFPNIEQPVSSGHDDLNAIGTLRTQVASMQATINTLTGGVGSAASVQYVNNAVAQAEANALRRAYPVGSIYVSNIATNPATLFGFGNWEAFGTGRVMVGVGSGTDTDGTQRTFTLGQTGGIYDQPLISPNYQAGTTAQRAGRDNMQPFVVVHMWRRTA